MDFKKVVNKLKKEYPGKKIIKNPEEIICEIDPTQKHPEKSVALAVVGKSALHYHKHSTEIYEAVKGELIVFKDGKKFKLKPGEKITIKPGEIHWAEGKESWFKTYSRPGWTAKDQILIKLDPKITFKKISFKVDKQKLTGTLIYPRRHKVKNPGVLFIHGWTSNEAGNNPRAQALANLGFICLTFNLRGHGTSKGILAKLSRKDHLEDVISAYDYLTSQPKVDKNKIGVIGSSYGGYLSPILSSKRKIKWLVLRAPALYADNTFKLASKKVMNEDKSQRARKYKETKIGFNNLALQSLAKFIGDVILIKSEKDEIIPEHYTRNYIKAINPKAKFNLNTIKGADHGLSQEKWKQEYIKILENWFGEKI